DIYQNCRTSEEINQAFDQLEKELESNDEIRSNFQKARDTLLEHFDAQVINKLQVTAENTTRYLDKYEKWLWEVTRFFLKDQADFNHNGTMTFTLRKDIQNGRIHQGKYVFLQDAEGYSRYRMRHPLARYIIETL